MLFSEKRDENGRHLPVTNEELSQVVDLWQPRAPKYLLATEKNMGTILQYLSEKNAIWSLDNIDAAVSALTHRGELDWQPAGVNLPKPNVPTIRPPDPPKPDFRTAAEKLNALGIPATSLVNHADAIPHKEKSNMAKAMFDDIKKKARAAEMRLKLRDAQTLTIQGPGGKINWAATNDARRAAVQQVERDYSDI